MSSAQGNRSDPPDYTDGNTLPGTQQLKTTKSGKSEYTSLPPVASPNVRDDIQNTPLKPNAREPKYTNPIKRKEDTEGFTTPHLES
ncbi:hypothetical protein TNCV_2633511 [Trichonephila clavipes]|nr:hypothetical protein TNCV_2633511 [Trichonephila clavipes]